MCVNAGEAQVNKKKIFQNYKKQRKILLNEDSDSSKEEKQDDTPPPMHTYDDLSGFKYSIPYGNLYTEITKQDKPHKNMPIFPSFF